MRIACLHTAASNAAVFDAACPSGVMLSHADTVALAQVSMTPAARLAGRAVLTVPEAALAACLERS